MVKLWILQKIVLLGQDYVTRELTSYLGTTESRVVRVSAFSLYQSTDKRHLKI